MQGRERKMDKIKTNASRLCCGLTGNDEVAARHDMINALGAAALERQELPDGFAIRFPGDELMCGKLAKFIVFERVCCPFLSFNLDFEPNHGPIWMRVQGPTGAKEFIESEVALSGGPAMRGKE